MLPEDAGPAPDGVPEIRGGSNGAGRPPAPASRELAGKVVVAEGGPTLAGVLASLGLIDEFFLTVSPRVVAGGSGRVVHGPDADPSVWHLDHGFVDDDGFLFLRYVRSSPPANGRRVSYTASAGTISSSGGSSDTPRNAASSAAVANRIAPMIAAHAPTNAPVTSIGAQPVDADREHGADEADEREREQCRAAERERGAHPPVARVPRCARTRRQQEQPRPPRAQRGDDEHRADRIARSVVGGRDHRDADADRVQRADDPDRGAVVARARRAAPRSRARTRPSCARSGTTRVARPRR